MANYSDESIQTMMAKLDAMLVETMKTSFALLRVAHAEPEGRLKDHLTNGAARRILVIRRSVQNLFQVFPPSRMVPLINDELQDVQIYLQSTLSNISGLCDNLAWAFVTRHGADDMNRNGIGLWRKDTQTLMHGDLRDYLNAPERKQWAAEYLTDFRDATAHRIPAYVPPRLVTTAEAARYGELDLLRIQALEANDLIMFDRFVAEQDAIGQTYPVFMHSYVAGDVSKVISLHPQLLSDAEVCVDLVGVFLEHWGKRSWTELPAYKVLGYVEDI